MRNLLEESLRLHTPLGFNRRLCTKNYKVPGSAFEIKAGESVFISVSALHKNEKYFTNPLKFDPERFSKRNASRLYQNAYQPFGIGPRMCLGKKYNRRARFSEFSEYSVELTQVNKTFIYQEFFVTAARLAELEIAICLVSIISRFKLIRCEKTEVPITMASRGFITSPQNGIWLSVEQL